jgi:DNA processing protein
MESYENASLGPQEPVSEETGLSVKERSYLYWLTCLRVLGAVSIRKLYEYFCSFERIFYIEEKELEESQILKQEQMQALLTWKQKYPECREAFLALGDSGIRSFTPSDPQYPARLKELHDYPMMLFAKGRLPEDEKPSVAIVGARGCSDYGERITEEFARALSAEQVQIISGLAMGIDGAAHRGSLSVKQGRTFGVLGCGVNICYPMQNYELYEAMQEHGGVISEFPAGCEPLRRHFPMRNRIISGLSDAVLVVEAKEKSGSLITAELGLDQGREIFAVPGRITDHLSEGCNRLIAQGAHLASSPDDILEYLGIVHQKKLIIREKNTQRLAKKEKMVYSCLDFSPRHLDQISEESGLSVTDCMGILLELELGGYVFRASNQYYGRKL